MEQFIEDSSLEDWKVIGSGGFGQIYKARHRQWAFDVAIKLLRYDDGTNASLLREIKRMQEASSPHVIRVLGVFKGLPSNTKSGFSKQLGVVMELMERGSLASLQLTDFGLSRITYSVTQVSKKDDKEGGGTTNYMPPEAFGLTYKPKRAFDIYSYAILIWSIVTGKQPYGNAQPTRVELLIPEGQRPLLDDIKGDALGLAELTGLLQRCWDNKPEQRPRALECTTETEHLYKMHKDAIFDAVHEVQKKLDQKAKEKSHDTAGSEGSNHWGFSGGDPKVPEWSEAVC
ncbi:ankyrin repeat and protein kinase domain-containing protein 1-like isoform X2 [Perca fluviatilis]|uniref:ankyrin repeat and protein kinase domain-containing protein 1-like isoform X2 n=1 Tax=Perca fluviatilis TaxID=8168 RepID=UPI00196599F4|nr:ankyrin repeat and protein kinase domain-containing protein 1-like isoform X2 [Perca fluviatilis]